MADRQNTEFPENQVFSNFPKIRLRGYFNIKISSLLQGILEKNMELGLFFFVDGVFRERAWDIVYV